MKRGKFSKRKNFTIFLILILLLFNLVSHLQLANSRKTLLLNETLFDFPLSTQNNHKENDPIVQFAPYAFVPFIVRDEVLFLNDDLDTITIYDISDLSNPEVLSSTDLGLNLTDIYLRYFLLIDDDLLFSIRRSNSKNYFEIINVSSLYDPFLEAEIVLTGDLLSLYSFGVMNLEQHKFFFIGGMTVDFTNTEDIDIEFIDYRFGSELGSDYNDYQRYVVKDNLMILPTKNASNAVGIVIYEFESFSQPVKIGEWFGELSLPSIYFAALDNERFYMGYYEISIFNLTEITTPTRLGSFNITEEFQRMVFYNNYITTMNLDKLAIYNATDIEAVSVVGIYEVNDSKLGLLDHNKFDQNKITEDRIYCTLNPSDYRYKTLAIINWSDPTNPTVLAFLGLPKTSTNRFSAIGYLEFLLVNLVMVISVTFIRLRKKKASHIL